MDDAKQELITELSKSSEKSENIVFTYLTKFTNHNNIDLSEFTLPNAIDAPYSYIKNFDSDILCDNSSLRKEHGEKKVSVRSEFNEKYNCKSNVWTTETPKNTQLCQYKNTDLHRYWMSDEKAKHCYDCAQKFTSLRRKHHCRLCGQIFCFKCCNQILSGKVIMCTDDLKVCLYCYNMVHNHIKLASILPALEADLKLNDLFKPNDITLKEMIITRVIEKSRKELMIGITNQIYSNSFANQTMKKYQLYSLKSLHEEMLRILPHENLGMDLLWFLLMTGISKSNFQATETINALVTAGFLIPNFSCSKNKKNHTSSCCQLNYRDVGEIPRKREIGLHLINKTSKESKTGLLDVGSDEYNIFKSNMERITQILISYNKHEDFLIKLLLKKDNLHESWANILVPICREVANGFRPLSTNNYSSTDIRNMVSFKKVTGGSKNECYIKGGVIFTKNVAHKSMANKLKNPKVLLIQCPIVYERVEHKYITMESLLLQEKEYLRNVVVRILSLKVHIILVQSGMARIAQEILLSFGIIFILNVKSSVMHKLARCMKCDIITSIESNIKIPKLGTCDLFSTEYFTDHRGKMKSIMGFEVYISPRNYAIILRGGTNEELGRVKSIASTLLYFRYNWRFEMSFLLDICASPVGINLMLCIKEFFIFSKTCTYCKPAETKDSSICNPPDNKSEINKQEFSYNEKFSACESPKALIFGTKMLPSYFNKSEYPQNNVRTERKHINVRRDVHTYLADWRAFHRSSKSAALLYKSILSTTRSFHTVIGNSYFDAKSYQHIPVLFSCFYFTPKRESSFCVEPTLFEMNFYGKNDIMLGQFLETCFRNNVCHSCDLPTKDHIRRYVHSNGCIQARISTNKKLIKPDEIHVSSCCTVCNESTSAVALSQDAWCLSFAKYLELRFYDTIFPNCLREEFVKEYFQMNSGKSICLHTEPQNYVHCFEKNDLNVKFTYTYIDVWEISFPQLIIHISKNIRHEIVNFAEIKNNLSIKGHSAYLRLFKQITENKTMIDSEYKTNLIISLNQDYSVFKRSIEDMNTLLFTGRNNIIELRDLLTNTNESLDHVIKSWNFKLDVKLCPDTTLTQKLTTNSLNIFGNSLICSEPNNSKLKNKNEIAIRTQLMTDLQKYEIGVPLPGCYFNSSQMNISPLILNELDFGSIIAFCLKTEEYSHFIHLQTYKKPSDNCIVMNSIRILHTEPVDDKRSDEDKKNKAKTHFEISFQDVATQFVCKMYFAKEFDLFRDEIFEMEKTDNDADIRNAFARSLSISVSWEARGGKSGSKFRKTWDDRFILKEMTKGDIASFENFGSNYFEYMKNCYNCHLTTLLTKILGVYKISVKKKDSYQERTLLVMENLFFGSEIKDKFDLKGSERNRHVNTENLDGEIVLLDENLIKMSWSKPLYIQPDSKKCLREAINSDSLFLEQNDIIDYSLLVGLNKKNGTLILGIIDYIRNFTFDKRLESLFKQSGLLGGQGKLPTVIAPQHYRHRFTEAMERYFLVAPHLCD